MEMLARRRRLRALAVVYTLFVSECSDWLDSRSDGIQAPVISNVAPALCAAASALAIVHDDHETLPAIAAFLSHFLAFSSAYRRRCSNSLRSFPGLRSARNRGWYGTSLAVGRPTFHACPQPFRLFAGFSRLLRPLARV